MHAFEPSAVMRAARPAARPATDAPAEDLPLPDGAVDAAMAVLTIHHWTDPRQGVREMRRVSRGPVAILTYDMPLAVERLWIVRDYLPEIGALDLGRFPPVGDIAAWLGGAALEVVPCPNDCADGFLGAYWGRPEAYLDPVVQAANSALPALDPQIVARGMGRLAGDLSSGAWDRRHGWLRRRREHDIGLRLIVAEPVPT